MRNKISKIVNKIINRIKKAVKFIGEEIKRFSWGKVLLHVSLSFLIPVIFFSVTFYQNGTSSFLVSLKDKMNSGILFSTCFNLCSTIVSSSIQALKLSDNYLGGEVMQEENIINKVKNYNRVLYSIIACVILIILSAFYYAKVDISNSMTVWGIIAQIILYIISLGIYGVNSSSIRDMGTPNGKEIVDNREREVEKSVRMTREVGIDNINKKLL